MLWVWVARVARSARASGTGVGGVRGAAGHSFASCTASVWSKRAGTYRPPHDQDPRDRQRQRWRDGWGGMAARGSRRGLRLAVAGPAAHRRDPWPASSPRIRTFGTRTSASTETRRCCCSQLSPEVGGAAREVGATTERGVALSGDTRRWCRPVCRGNPRRWSRSSSLLSLLSPNLRARQLGAPRRDLGNRGTDVGVALCRDLLA